MQSIKIKNEQCFIDVVLEATGNLNNVLLMAVANNTSITDENVVGSDYKVVGTINRPVVDRLRTYPPGTSLAPLDIEILEGVGYWIVNKDFKVSYE